MHPQRHLLLTRYHQELWITLHILTKQGRRAKLLMSYSDGPVQSKLLMLLNQCWDDKWLQRVLYLHTKLSGCFVIAALYCWQNTGSAFFHFNTACYLLLHNWLWHRDVIFDAEYFMYKCINCEANILCAGPYYLLVVALLLLFLWMDWSYLKMSENGQDCH